MGIDRPAARRSASNKIPDRTSPKNVSVDSDSMGTK
jgi:hypothetical protein